MRTVFISANDTGSGKTYVTAALACHLLQRGHSVQVVKVVETGVTAATPPEQTDAGFVAAFARRHVPTAADALTTTTLQHFATPLAPVDAAQLDGCELSFTSLLAHYSALPKLADYILVEGAGGLAVPLENAGTATTNGTTPPAPYNKPAPDASATVRDWADFALAIHADATVLVVTDRLGAINQARLLAAYAIARGLPQTGLWLNEAQPHTPANVRTSNARTLQAGAALLPLWATQNYAELWPKTIHAPWLK